MISDRYPSDILGSPHPNLNRNQKQAKTIPAKLGLVIEDVSTGWVGAIVRVEKTAEMTTVTLENAKGQHRSFPLGAGFWLEGEPVILVRPKKQAPQGPLRTASGAYYSQQKAKVAAPNRIWVEGLHDAELIEKVWGYDLRDGGIVVEVLNGADNLATSLSTFGPGPKRKCGILLDHLVENSKEARIAADVYRQFGKENVLILGHPYIDIWQAIKPQTLKIESWPQIPKGLDWKTETLKQLGIAHKEQSDVATAWKLFLSKVKTYRDLETPLVRKVEELIDFVIAP